MSGMGIYGLSGSGIDVDSMVKMGMMTKQNQYDKMYKQEVKNEWLKEAYTDMYSSINTFNSSTLYNYKLSATTSPMSAASSNTSVATATANADAASMSHTVNVTATASNAYLLSTEAIGRKNEDAAKSIYLKDVLFSESDQNDLMAAMQGDSTLAKKELISFTIADGSGTSANSKKISFTYEDILESNETLNDLVAKINNAGVNIKASYDSANDAFSFYQKEGGAANKIILSASSGDGADNGRALLNSLNLGKVTQAVDSNGNLTSNLSTKISMADAGATIEAAGVSASVKIDGREYTSDTGKVTVGNVTYSLTALGSTTVTVSQDTDKLIENVKKFVEDYNKMLDSLNDKYHETKYSDYGVLTKSQEDGMTKEQVEKWNEKAKSGLLNHDANIGKIISEMREALYTPVESATGKYNSMMSIGISSKTDRGHLYLDEDKLKKALAAEPDCVRQIFTASGEKTDSKGNTYTDYKSEGVVQRISDSLYKNLKTMKSYAGTSTDASDGSTLGDLISNLQTKMSNFKTMMKSYENLLYKKYDAMETAIQRLSVSMGYITGGQ